MSDWNPYQEIACIEAFCDENWGEYKTWCDENDIQDITDEFTMFDYCQKRWGAFESFADLWVKEVGHADLLDERKDHN